MKRVVAVIGAFLLLIVGGQNVSAEPSAEAAVLYAPATHELVYAKNPEEKLSMASTTKIMTSYLTLRYIEQMGDKTVTITEEMVAVEGSSMGLKAGDQISLYDLCVGMMLCSGNDAANSAAIAVSGSKEKFAQAMNRAAKEMGMENSSFVTPSGLDDENHFTTAYDMALLAATAMEDEEFEAIVSSQYRDVTYHSVEKGEITIRLKNHNKLLSFMDDCVGIKTGFTKKSGRCLVSAVRRYDTMLICVTLNAPDDWNDHISLYQEGFSNIKQYEPQQIEFSPQVTQGDGKILRLEDAAPLYYFTEGQIEERVFLPRFIYPDWDGPWGKVEYIKDGAVIATREIE